MGAPRLGRVQGYEVLILVVLLILIALCAIAVPVVGASGTLGPKTAAPHTTG